MTAGKDNAYDEIPYPKMPHRRTHPRHTEAIATLFGMNVPPVPQCRVLELGCASGDNLIPQAQDLPEGRFLGIDLSAVQVEEGMRAIRALGLTNIELRHASIMDVAPDWGRFDYIICHGVFSWVPPHVQDKIVQICKANLAENGVALVSYNTYPGWHFHGMIRDMMIFHAAQFEDPQERITQARGLLNFLVENAREETAYGRMLKESVEHLRDSEDGYVYHEHLEENNRPIYFHEFVDRAGAAGLQYLGESDFVLMLSSTLPAKAQEMLKGISIARQEQYMDFVRNRSFRSTLLCHAGVPLNRHVTPAVLCRFHMTTTERPDVSPIEINDEGVQEIAVAKGQIRTDLPLIKAAVVHLAEYWPRTFTLQELHAAALEKLTPAQRSAGDPQRIGVDTLAAHLMAFFSSGLLELAVHPPQFACQVSHCPVASPLARLQAGDSQRVTNQRHEHIRLDAVGRALIRRLDGRHDRKDLETTVQEAIDSGGLVVRAGDERIRHVAPDTLSNLVGQTLSKFREKALLVA